MHMSRRTLLGLASTVPSLFPAFAHSAELQDGNEWIAPPALRPGDTVIFVAPAGPVDGGKVEKARRVFEARGIKVLIPKGLLSRRVNYLAGTDSDRLKELNDAIANPDIAGIFACRGDYGLRRIVDGVDFEAAQDPAVIVGATVSNNVLAFQGGKNNGETIGKIQF